MRMFRQAMGTDVWRRRASALGLFLWLSTAGCGSAGLADDPYSGASPVGHGTALLSWNRNPEPDVAGYRVYYRPAFGIYNPAIDVGNDTTATITGLRPGTYYFAVTAYDDEGYESALSQEVSKSIR